MCEREIHYKRFRHLCTAQAQTWLLFQYGKYSNMCIRLLAEEAYFMIGKPGQMIGIVL